MKQPFWTSVPWWVGGLGAWGLAFLFVWVGPDGRTAPEPARFWIRWGHSIGWVLIGLSLVLRPWVPPRWAHRIAGLGGLSYAGFVVTWWFFGLE